MSSPTERSIELPADYYHTNFCALLDFVADRYHALLSADERDFFQSFKTVEPQAQKLYIRLLTRKGDFFRANKLAYPELTPLNQWAEVLSAAGLLDINPQMALSDVMALLTKAELLQRSGQTKLKTLKRAELEISLQESALQESVLAGEGAEQALVLSLVGDEPIYQVKQGGCFDTFKLCFFGNMHQDMTDYVLRDLGLMVYEDYSLDTQALPFQSRGQLEQHLQYYQCQEQLETQLQSSATDMLALTEQLPTADPNDATLIRRVERFQLTVARQLERIEALDEALALYRSCARAPSRERQARILVKQHKIDEALHLCQKIQGEQNNNIAISAYINEEEQVFAREFGWRTARKHLSADTLKAWNAPEKYTPQTDTVVLEPGDKSVETLAAEHLAASGECFFVENTLLTGVLGLYCWDIIFASISGAFFNPFQHAPADFSSPDFIVQREQQFSNRLETLTMDSLNARVWQHWEQKQGRANPLVHWAGLSEDLLTLSLDRIPLAHWRAIFVRLLRDIRNHRSGLPDLIHFPLSGSYELVEIKGPGDKLQKNQIRWMAYFSAHGIPHRALHVRYPNES